MGVSFDKRLSWCENILVVLRDGKWRSRRQIKNMLGLDHEKEKARTRVLSIYILRLVKRGYVERAHAPDVLMTDPLDNVKYVYRRTAKPYFRLYGLAGRQAQHTTIANKRDILR